VVILEEELVVVEVVVEVFEVEAVVVAVEVEEEVVDSIENLKVHQNLLLVKENIYFVFLMKNSFDQ
jgi:hypothetical protein